MACKRSEIEEIRSDSGADGLALMARKLGYKSEFGQLIFSNGATASDLFEFFDDNPGAVEAVINWVLEEGRDRDGNELLDEGEEEEGGDTEEEEGEEDE